MLKEELFEAKFEPFTAVVVIAGSRTVPRAYALDSVSRFLSRWLTANDGCWAEECAVFSGGCPKGADAVAEECAAVESFNFVEFPAAWNNVGGALNKKAGLDRNVEMANAANKFSSHPPTLFALWDGKSRGTAHMILEAHKRGWEVEVEVVA